MNDTIEHVRGFANDAYLLEIDYTLFRNLYIYIYMYIYIYIFISSYRQQQHNIQIKKE